MPRVWQLALLFWNLLILGYMIVQFVHFNSNRFVGENEFWSAAVDAALSLGCSVSRDGCLWRIAVPSWYVWLRCLSRAFSVCSRLSFVDVMRCRWLFRVYVGGVPYNTAVWFDDVNGGLRYGVAE